MRYFFVFIAILVVWIGIIAMAAVLPSGSNFSLYFAAQALTLILFLIGFYRK